MRDTPLVLTLQAACWQLCSCSSAADTCRLQLSSWQLCLSSACTERERGGRHRHSGGLAPSAACSQLHGSNSMLTLVCHAGPAPAHLLRGHQAVSSSQLCARVSTCGLAPDCPCWAGHCQCCGLLACVLVVCSWECVMSAMEQSRLSASECGHRRALVCVAPPPTAEPASVSASQHMRHCHANKHSSCWLNASTALSICHTAPALAAKAAACVVTAHVSAVPLSIHVLAAQPSVCSLWPCPSLCLQAVHKTPDWLHATHKQHSCLPRSCSCTCTCAATTSTQQYS